MKNIFEKYFLSLIFILLSGLALLHANSFLDSSYQFSEIQEVSAENSDAPFQFHALPNDYSNYQKSFIELTESEEFELVFKESRRNLPLLTAGLIAVFFYVFPWETSQKLFCNSRFSASPIRTGLSKRYIQFEVFRI